MIRYKHLIPLLLPLSCLSHAQDVIYVEAEKLPYNIKESYQKIHILNEDEINESSAQSLSELLDAYAQIYSVNRGGNGQNGSLLIRGLDSYHTTVVIDGVVMNDPTDPNRAFNFNELNTADIEKIEILKGAQSQLYGANSLGGVIFIRTKRANKKGAQNQFTQNSAFNNNSFKNHSLSLSHRNRLDRLGYKLSGNLATSGNQSAMIKDQRKEEKDTVESKIVNLNLDYDLNSNHYFELTAKHRDHKADYDETYPINPNANNKLKQKENVLNFNHNGTWNEQISSEFQTSFKTNKRDLYASSRYQYEGEEERTNIYLLWQASKTIDLSLAGHYFREKIKFDEGSGANQKSQNALGTSISIQKKSDGENSPWFISTGVRLEDPNLTKSSFTYRGVTGYHLNPQDTVKTSFTKGVNNPSLYSLYGFGGNLNLHPEESYQGELSYETKLDEKHTFVISYFQTYFKDKFQYNSSSSLMENIGGARIEGLEAELQFTGSKEEIKLSGSFLEARAISQNKKLAYRPTTMTKLHYARYIDDTTKVGFYFSAIGKQYDSGEKRLDKYTLFDFYYQKTLTQDLNLELFLKNALNKAYVNETNFSEAGRTFGFKTQYNF